MVENVMVKSGIHLLQTVPLFGVVVVVVEDFCHSLSLFSGIQHEL